MFLQDVPWNWGNFLLQNKSYRIFKFRFPVNLKCFEYFPFMILFPKRYWLRKLSWQVTNHIQPSQRLRQIANKQNFRPELGISVVSPHNFEFRHFFFWWDIKSFNGNSSAFHRPQVIPWIDHCKPGPSL